MRQPELSMSFQMLSEKSQAVATPTESESFYESSEKLRLLFHKTWTLINVPCLLLSGEHGDKAVQW